MRVKLSLAGHSSNQKTRGKGLHVPYKGVNKQLPVLIYAFIKRK